jgi:hypothetical protein
MKRIISSTLLAAVAVGWTACIPIEPIDDYPDGGEAESTDPNCGNKKCHDALTVEIIRADNQTFIFGLYSFDVEFDDGSTGFVECFYGYGASDFVCDMGDVNLIVPHLASNQGTISLTIYAAPATAAVQVAVSGWVVGVRTFSPMYDEIAPNGAECDPICYEASAMMAVESW